MSTNIPFDLVEQFARGNGVILIGAGLSMDAGLPGWQALLTPLAESIRLPQDRRTDLLKVAQYYENTCGRQALIAHVQEQTDTVAGKPTDNHRRLARLGVRTWVTTYYDDLIEQTLREGGDRFNVVVRDQDLPYVSADAVTLLKLHGDRRQPDTIVISEQDYCTYFRRFPRVKDKLTGLLLEKTFLFVGYGINDPDFNQLRAEIAYDLRQHARLAYAILFDADEFTIADLRAQNVQVINAALTGQPGCSERLGKLLDALVEQVDLARQQRRLNARTTVTVIPSPDAADVRGLLEAMGYRISDSKTIGADIYFLCEAKWGAEIRQEMVHFIGETPTASDIAALNDAVVSYDAGRGVFLTHHPLPAPLRDLVRQRERIQCYTLDEFTDRLADFRPYLERLIADYEASEIPQYYVPLSVEAVVGEDREPRVFKPIESFVEAWLAEPGRNHLSILGDFGSGKTWFGQRYAYLAAKRHLADPAHNRIPILITLRDYSRAYNVEQLITDAIANRYKVSLAAGYKTFARLNQAGRLLLIFDGFDEMERRVSDYRTIVDNFWELAKVVDPPSKVLLTCRTAYFRHRGEEEETLTPRRRQINMTAGNQVIDLRDHQGFELMHLLDFDDEDIRLALQKRQPADWEPVYQRIRQLINLRDLAGRPVLLDMIVKTLPQMQDARQINQAILYATYVDALLRRRWSEDTDYIPPLERLFFMKELAWEMYLAQRLSIPFSEFPERVMRHFCLRDDPQRAAFFERDVRTQSYLERDDAGNYHFSHKSFMEYFVTRKMVDTFSGSDIDIGKAIEVWKTQPLTPEVRDFLVDMAPDSALLWQLIDATRGRSVSDVGYMGGNAATMLRLGGHSFAMMDLSRTMLIGADLSHADLTGARLEETSLRQATLKNCRLAMADLRGADLTQAKIDEMACTYSVAWNRDNDLLAVAGSALDIYLWHIDSWDRPCILRQQKLSSFEQHAWSLAWHPTKKHYLACGLGNGYVTIWNTKTQVCETVLPAGISVGAIRWSQDGRYLATECQDEDALRIWDSETWQALRTLQVKYHQGRNYSLIAPDFDSSSRYVLSGDREGYVTVWELQNGDVVLRKKLDDDTVNAVFATDGQGILTFLKDGKTHLLTGDQVSLSLPVSSLALLFPEYSLTGTDNLAIELLSALSPLPESEARSAWSVSFNTRHRCIATGYFSQGLVRIWSSDEMSSSFARCIRTLETRTDCRGTRIAGAIGLEAPAPNNRGTLRTWLVARGALEN